MSSTASSQAAVSYLEVTANADGQRLDNYLLNQLKGAPKTLIYRIIRKGEVRVNKKRAKADTRLQAGDQIRVPPIRLAEKASVTPVGASLRDLLLGEALLFENEAVLVFNKPAGLAVHGGSGVRIGLIEALRQVRPELTSLELVHRLDKDTSGCILLAKTRQALNFLQDQLRAQSMGKFYQAWVVGDWPNNLHEINAPIDRASSPSGERRMRIADFKEGKASLTRFRIIKKHSGVTLIEAEPVTGRTHQIRVHATSAGFPLIGDPKYGKDTVNEQFRRAGVGRMFLHARRLEFLDPQTLERLSIEAPLDDSWQKVEHVKVGK